MHHVWEIDPQKKKKKHCSCESYLASSISSGTALMLVKPFRKTTKTLLAPQRRAEVAQSNAAIIRDVR